MIILGVSAGQMLMFIQSEPPLIRGVSMSIDEEQPDVIRALASRYKPKLFDFDVEGQYMYYYGVYRDQSVIMRQSLDGASKKVVLNTGEFYCWPTLINPTVNVHRFSRPEVDDGICGRLVGWQHLHFKPGCGFHCRRSVVQYGQAEDRVAGRRHETGKFGHQSEAWVRKFGFVGKIVDF